MRDQYDFSKAGPRFPLEVRYHWDAHPEFKRPDRSLGWMYDQEWHHFRNYKSAKARADAIKELEKKTKLSPHRLERVSEYRIPEDA